VAKAKVANAPAWYLTPHGVQEFGDLRDLEDEEGRIVIECAEGETFTLERVVF
jgi:hypothetical protein